MPAPAIPRRRLSIWRQLEGRCPNLARNSANAWLWNDRSEVHLRWRAGANLGSLRSLANARFGTDLCSGLRGCDDGLCRGGEFSARTFAAGGLTADAGAFQEKGEGVG